MEKVGRVVFESDSVQHLLEQAGLIRFLFLLLQVRRVMLWRRWKENQLLSMVFVLHWFGYVHCSAQLLSPCSRRYGCGIILLRLLPLVLVWSSGIRSYSMVSKYSFSTLLASCHLLIPLPLPFSFYGVFLRLLGGGTYLSIAHSIAPYANTSGGSQYRI